MEQLQVQRILDSHTEDLDYAIISDQLEQWTKSKAGVSHSDIEEIINAIGRNIFTSQFKEIADSIGLDHEELYETLEANDNMLMRVVQGFSMQVATHAFLMGCTFGSVANRES